MKYIVTVDYMAFEFDDSTTADKFAAIAFNHAKTDDGKRPKVKIEYKSNEEAQE